MNRILLVEDEPGLILTVTDMLKGEGYAVESIADGIQAKELIVEETFDLIILDVMLPGMSGFDICRKVREEGRTAPILMLTARDQISDKVRGLKLGADDYLAKPFAPTELLARVEALLRRVTRENPPVESYAFGSVHVDLKKERVFRSGRRVGLSEREYALLKYLIERRGSVVSREQLLLDVWAYSTAPTTRTVDVHIAMLRQKLEKDPKDPEFVITVHSQGYRFVG